MEPIHAGLTFKKVLTLPSYSATSYTMRARLVNSTKEYDIAAAEITGSGTSWTLLIPKTDTADYTAGQYTLQLIAIDLDGESEIPVYAQAIRVLADGAADIRTQNQIILDQLNEVIDTKSTQDYASLSIKGRSISRMTWEEILIARAKFTRLVNEEKRIKAGGGRIKTVKVRFTNA